eukprot:TRINITY_DN98_c2_g1_i1.p1 TRINITY_DN98_c2_g1~~TRINITY_DN98_c2_g1_i1.p1  ORF type:complete len:529 (-),score=91.31 TRINITY_DN98_c2_g1_i1:36-1622(-)
MEAADAASQAVRTRDLLDMGFATALVEEAACRCRSTEEALEWILRRPSTPTPGALPAGWGQRGASTSAGDVGVEGSTSSRGPATHGNGAGATGAVSRASVSGSPGTACPASAQRLGGVASSAPHQGKASPNAHSQQRRRSRSPRRDREAPSASATVAQRLRAPLPSVRVSNSEDGADAVAVTVGERQRPQQVPAQALASAPSAAPSAASTAAPPSSSSRPLSRSSAQQRRPQGVVEVSADGGDDIELGESEATCCCICTEELAPWSSVRLPCGHGSYCATCIRRHVEARLDVGAHEVHCPECDFLMGQAMLRALLPAKLFERLLERSLERAVNASDDLWPCPTPNCPNRVALEEGQQGRFNCDLCRTECCLRCRVSPFHVGFTCEGWREHRRRAASDRGRRVAEAGSGTSSAAAAAAAAAESAERSETALREWMEQTGSKQCPKCRMVITKQDLGKQLSQRSECHKMICRNCSTRFCFRCLAVLRNGFSCGCTGDNHGFIDPVTGRFVAHVAGSRSNQRQQRGASRGR